MASFSRRVTSVCETAQSLGPVVMVTRCAALLGFSRKLHSRQQHLPSSHAVRDASPTHPPASKNGSFFAFSAALKKSSAAFCASHTPATTTL